MRKILFAIFCATLVGCRGPQGDRGDSGTGQQASLSGNVTGNDFTVTDARLKNTNGIVVYVGDTASGRWIALPNYDPILGVLGNYVLKTGSLQILNAAALGATAYRIQVFSANAPSSRTRLLD